jgi:YD repeat-containing protein
MRTKSTILIIPTIALLCGMLFLSMCKKKEPDPEPSVQKQRLIEQIFFSSDIKMSTSTSSYSGELLNEIIDHDSTGMEWAKMVFEYNGNTITSFSRYEKTSGGWVKVSFSEINGYSGENPLEITTHYYDQSGVEGDRYKSVYTYEGPMLKKLEDFYLLGSSWQLARFETYNYDSQGRIVQITDTSVYYNGIVTTFTYDAVHMTECLLRAISQGSFTNIGKTIYHYAGNRLTGTTDYRWNSAIWAENGGSQFEYNAAGNLVRERFQGSGFFLRVDFAYGEGGGNYRQCMKATGNDVLPGDPFPSPVKSLKPEFFRTHPSIQK